MVFVCEDDQKEGSVGRDFIINGERPAEENVGNGDERLEEGGQGESIWGGGGR